MAVEIPGDARPTGEVAVTFVGESAGEGFSRDWVQVYLVRPGGRDAAAASALQTFSRGEIPLPAVEPLPAFPARAIQVREDAVGKPEVVLVPTDPSYACRWEGTVNDAGTLTSLRMHQREGFPIMTAEEAIARVFTEIERVLKGGTGR